MDEKYIQIILTAKSFNENFRVSEYLPRQKPKGCRANNSTQNWKKFLKNSFHYQKINKSLEKIVFTYLNVDIVDDS